MDYICPGCGLARSEDEMTDDGALCRICALAIEARQERHYDHWLLWDMMKTQFDDEDGGDE